jgi:putative polyhydroxyalkanoate system protein
MPALVVRRPHALPRTAVESVMAQWMHDAQTRFGLHCQLSADAQEVRIAFSHAGVTGTLVAQQDHFELTAQLGFLLNAYRPRIEAEVGRQLDALLGAAPGP